MVLNIFERSRLTLFGELTVVNFWTLTLSSGSYYYYYY